MQINQNKLYGHLKVKLRKFIIYQLKDFQQSIDLAIDKMMFSIHADNGIVIHAKVVTNLLIVKNMDDRYSN